MGGLRCRELSGSTISLGLRSSETCPRFEQLCLCTPQLIGQFRCIENGDDLALLDLISDVNGDLVEISTGPRVDYCFLRGKNFGRLSG